MPKVFRRIASYRFNASCKIHDLDYASARFTRLESDARFYAHTIRQARDSVFWKSAALVYFVVVRGVGRFFWNKVGER